MGQPGPIRGLVLGGGRRLAFAGRDCEGEEEEKEGEDNVHIMMLAQGAQVFIQLLDALLVRFYAFFLEALVELPAGILHVSISLLGMLDVMWRGVMGCERKSGGGNSTYAFPPHLFVVPLCFCFAAARLIILFLRSICLSFLNESLFRRGSSLFIRGGVLQGG
jgi:hypothetical protein